MSKTRDSRHHPKNNTILSLFYLKLERVFMEKRLTMILACLFLSLGMALAQTTVTGTVVSHEDGQPVVGATVRVVGNNAGTVTDVDGKFSVNAPSDAELSITYIGMKEARVKAGRNIRVVMESDDTALDELVVTGYGSARKLGTIAGSVSTAPWPTWATLCRVRWQVCRCSPLRASLRLRRA